MLYNEEWQSDFEINNSSNDSDSSYVPEDSSESGSSGDEWGKPGKPGKAGSAKHPVKNNRGKSGSSEESVGTSPVKGGRAVVDVTPWAAEFHGVSQTIVTTADDVIINDDNMLLPPPIDDKIFELLQQTNCEEEAAEGMEPITANGESFENSDKILVPMKTTGNYVLPSPQRTLRSITPSDFTSRENSTEPRIDFETPRMLTQKTDRILNSYFKLESGDGLSFICKICDKKFHTTKYIKRHMRSHLDFKEYECDICAKTFGRKYGLKVHRRTHLARKPHKCTICARGFREKTTLSQHMRVHSEERPFVCEICDRGFKSKKLLERHCFSHTNTKPFLCEYCDKTFTRKCSLTDHLRNHLPETKKHVCGFCGKAFHYNSALNKHMVVHTGKKKHICEICDVECNWSGSLYRHMSRAHGMIWSRKTGAHIMPDPRPVTGNNKFTVHDPDALLPPLRKRKSDVIEINIDNDSDSNIDCSV